MWQLETQLFASLFIELVYIFEASYSTVVTWVGKKSNVDQSVLSSQKKLVSDCKVNYIINKRHNSSSFFFKLSQRLSESLSCIIINNNNIDCYAELLQRQIKIKEIKKYYLEFSLGQKTRQMPNLSSLLHNFHKSEPLDPDSVRFSTRFQYEQFFGLVAFRSWQWVHLILLQILSKMGNLFDVSTCIFSIFFKECVG